MKLLLRLLILVVCATSIYLHTNFCDCALLVKTFNSSKAFLSISQEWFAFTTLGQSNL